MKVSISETVAGAIVSVLSATGYGGLLALMMLESACIPLPSEVILPFAGFLVAQGKMTLWLAATVGALGCNAGSVLAYEVGRQGGRGVVERWGKFVLLTRTDISRADRFFERFGGLAVLLARMLPIVRTFIALPAGISRMPRLRFHIYTFLGSWPWCFLLIYLGMKLGDRWSSGAQLDQIFRYVDYAIGAVAALAVARFVWHRRHLI